MAMYMNEKIIDKIRDGDFSKDIKEFLKDILTFELLHSEEEHLRYTDKYEEFVDRYTMSCGEKE